MTLSKQTKHYTRTICTLAFTNKHKLGSIWPKSWKLMKTRGPEFGSRQCIKCSCQNTKLARIRTYIRVYEWANGLLSPDLGKYDYWFWPWIWAILELIEVLMIDGIENWMYLILTAIPYQTLPKLDVWRASDTFILENEVPKNYNFTGTIF